MTWYSKGSSEQEKILEKIAEAFLDEVPANLYDRRRGFAARVRRNSFYGKEKQIWVIKEVKIREKGNNRRRPRLLRRKSAN